MIWHGYTGAAGWMFRQAIEGVLGYRLVGGQVVPPSDPEAAAADLGEAHVSRDVDASPLPRPKLAGANHFPSNSREPVLPPSPSGRGSG
jgi:cyclic beta-1,2-glucan synthetase